MATKSRSRKRKPVDTDSTPAADGAVEPLTAPAADETAEPALSPVSRPAAAQAAQRVGPADNKNVSAFEGTLSVYAGGVLIAAALFPRTLKQLVLLAMGGAFLYRGQSRHCHLYSAVGLNTNKEGLVRQINEKLGA